MQSDLLSDHFSVLLNVFLCVHHLKHSVHLHVVYGTMVQVHSQ